ncbi:MAG: hypothetical protein H6Q67_803 [Firmicutes bacterium]|nr:hypothetical protein [Bacillota bacterium]
MIVIYHGRRMFWPYIACQFYLNTGDSNCVSLAPSVSKHQPLMKVGIDGAGTVVYCLAHGAYRCLYRRALTGMSTLFGLPLVFYDVDYLLYKKARHNIGLRLLVLAAAYIPWLGKKLDVLTLFSVISPMASEVKG